MQKEDLHDFFVPILSKLFKEQNSGKFINITDCFTGQDFDFNDTIFLKLNQSEFLLPHPSNPAVWDYGFKKWIRKYQAKILPKGVIYYKEFIEQNK